MNVIDTTLFASGERRQLGIGFHNIGSGVLRASHETIIKQIEAFYGERCGHLPLDAINTCILVQTPTAALLEQIAYLSTLFGRDIKAITPHEVRQISLDPLAQRPLIVPYINVPESADFIQTELHADTWGLPASMVNILKNKADFYQLLDELQLDDFQTPDYSITDVVDLPTNALHFLQSIEEGIHDAHLSQYPLGLMLRAAESDGNYGCSLITEQNRTIRSIQNGDPEALTVHRSWQEALLFSQTHLTATMNIQREKRIVISRYVDMADSPGMSVVIIDNQVIPLGWNGQLQKPGSKACVGTSTYHPKTAALSQLQQDYEARTATFLEKLLRATAKKCSIDFASLRAVANLDIMLPSPLEERLQRSRGLKTIPYIAECNPRWTNYTDAIMAAMAANRQTQTIRNMQQTIQAGISTIDKYPLPATIEPRVVRELIFEKDRQLKSEGTRIICRMATNPMGLIFTGDVTRAQQELATLLHNKV